MQKLLLFFLSFFVLTSLSLDFPLQVHAKKQLPKSTQKTLKKNTAGGVKGVTTKVQIRGNRKVIIATFTNLEIASSVSYSLVYTQRGKQEGAGGSLADLSGIQTRELLFATCSAGVCRYHTGIKNARLIVTTILKDGRKVSKSFRIKV